MELAQKDKINLDYLGVHSLISELTAKYNQKNDVGIVRAWFRRNKLKSQEKHLQALSALVQEVRAHTTTLIEYKAELMTQHQRMEDLVLLKTEESQFAVDRQREEHATFLALQEKERQQTIHELEQMKIQNDQLKQEARLVRLRGNLIEKITGELDLKKISSAQAFVLIKALNQDNTEADIFMAEEQLDQMKAEAKIKKAEAKRAKIEADYEEYKMQESVKASKGAGKQ